MNLQQLNQESPFEKIKRTDEHGNEYWLARELMELVEYSSWQKFEAAIQRAITSLTTFGINPNEHINQTVNEFRDVHNRMRTQIDFRMTRHGCNLVFQNCDPSKPRVAEGQAYYSLLDLVKKQKPVDELAVLEQMFGVFKQQQIQINETRQLAQEAKQEIATVRQEVKTLAPTPNYFTIIGYASKLGVIVDRKEANALGRRAALISRTSNIPIGKFPHEYYGEVNSYHIDILDQVFSMNVEDNA